MVNDTGMLVVNQARANAIRVDPRCVTMDSGAHLVMNGKKLTQKLGLMAEDLAPYTFTIITSIGHVDRAIGYTRDPLQLIFQVKLGGLPAPFF